MPMAHILREQIVNRRRPSFNHMHIDQIRVLLLHAVPLTDKIMVLIFKPVAINQS